MRDSPWDPSAVNKVAWLFGTRIAQTILASDLPDRTQQAGHMDASEPISPKSSCATAAVHIWVPAFAGTTRGEEKSPCSLCGHVGLRVGEASRPLGKFEAGQYLGAETCDCAGPIQAR